MWYLTIDDTKGIHAQVLNIEWPPNVQPLDLPDFETQARRLRYQALGAQCRAQRLNTLLIAHHADDQDETALMRLASGHKGIGLRGMHSFSNIPECWGLHGIDCSGHYEIAANGREESSRSGASILLTRIAQRNQRILSHPPLFETGGVRVMRPLLGFRKQDLVDTCIAHNVEWVEDKTNKEAWRTPRNVARSLLNSARLPMALRNRSLSKLSLWMTGRERKHLRCASYLFAQSDILVFDLRSGSVVVRLPKSVDMEDASTYASRRFEVSSPLVASLLVRNLASLVTPQEDIPLRSLQLIAAAMFPQLGHPVQARPNGKTYPSKLTAAGVQFERLHLSKTDVVHDVKSRQPSTTHQRQTHRLDPEFSWSLTRQPFPNASTKPKIGGPEGLLTTILIPAGATSGKSYTSNVSSWSSWYLWDGRYWIRVMNGTNQALQVRPFCEADLQTIRKSLPSPQLKLFEQVLASAAPNKVRWTLPVISHAHGQLGKVLALPTLGKAGRLDTESEPIERRVDWEVRYKKVAIRKSDEQDQIANRDFITSWEDS